MKGFRFISGIFAFCTCLMCGGGTASAAQAYSATIEEKDGNSVFLKTTENEAKKTDTYDGKQLHVFAYRPSGTETEAGFDVYAGNDKVNVPVQISKDASAKWAIAIDTTDRNGRPLAIEQEYDALAAILSTFKEGDDVRLFHVGTDTLEVDFTKAAKDSRIGCNFKSAGNGKVKKLFDNCVKISTEKRSNSYLWTGLQEVLDKLCSQSGKAETLPKVMVFISDGHDETVGVEEGRAHAELVQACCAQRVRVITLCYPTSDFGKAEDRQYFYGGMKELSKGTKGQTVTGELLQRKGKQAGQVLNSPKILNEITQHIEAFKKKSLTLDLPMDKIKAGQDLVIVPKGKDRESPDAVVIPADKIAPLLEDSKIYTFIALIHKAQNGNAADVKKLTRYLQEEISVLKKQNVISEEQISAVKTELSTLVDTKLTKLEKLVEAALKAEGENADAAIRKVADFLKNEISGLKEVGGVESEWKISDEQLETITESLKTIWLKASQDEQKILGKWIDAKTRRDLEENQKKLQAAEEERRRMEERNRQLEEERRQAEEDRRRAEEDRRKAEEKQGNGYYIFGFDMLSEHFGLSLWVWYLVAICAAIIIIAVFTIIIIRGSRKHKAAALAVAGEEFMATKQSPSVKAYLVNKTAPSQVWNVMSSPCSVGRMNGNDIIIPSGFVSSRQFVLSLAENGAWCLQDAGSKNGTSVNGTPVRSTILRDGDVIRVADLELLFKLPNN